MPLLGIYTFCFHPNIMDMVAFNRLENFLASNRRQFIALDEISFDKASEKAVTDKLLSWLYFTSRKLRRMHSYGISD